MVCVPKHERGVAPPVSVELRVCKDRVDIKQADDDRPRGCSGHWPYKVSWLMAMAFSLPSVAIVASVAMVRSVPEGEMWP